MAEGANVGTKYLLTLNRLTGREKLGVVKESPYSLKKGRNEFIKYVKC